MRRLILILLALALAAPVAACGKKGSLHAPPGSEDSDFPRPYTQ
jgi:predicted small lipoprotein YifL